MSSTSYMQKHYYKHMHRCDAALTKHLAPLQMEWAPQIQEELHPSIAAQIILVYDRNQTSKLMQLYWKQTHLYRRQSSRYLSCFLSHSSVCSSNTALRRAVGLLPSVRPLRRDTTALLQAHLRVNMAEKVPAWTQSAYLVSWNIFAMSIARYRH